MKKLLLLLLGTMFIMNILAQAPQGFTYQAVVRNASGEPMSNQSVKFQLSLISEDGLTIHYAETHLATTTSQGIVNLVVGEGSTVLGVFADIPWETSIVNLKVEVDPSGGNTFTEMGIVPLKSVPYALSANTVNITGTTGQTLTHNGTSWVSDGNLFNNGTNVGVGTITPAAKFSISGMLNNPAIPSASSNSILRIGNQSYPTEGIDIGQSSSPYYAGWIQVGDNGSAEPLSLQPLAGNVGIGILNPSQKLDINGQIRIQGGNPGVGKVLTSDATGVASWATPSGGGSNWTVSGANIYRATGNVGVGNATPTGLLDVMGGDPTDEEPIFAVRNTSGDIVFAVYQSGVRMYVDESTTKGSRGGFAIGGIGDNLKLGNTYFQVTPDSVRINLREPTLKGSRGGFAIGGIGDNLKVQPSNLFYIGQDSARIYIDTTSARKGARGGFAIGGIGDNLKSNGPEFLRVTKDSTRVYVSSGGSKGSRGGFAIGGIGDNLKEPAASNFMFLTPDNYFIGHDAGANTTPINESSGKFNSFIGYQAGNKNTTGSSNVFIGFQSGFNSKTGSRNTYLGNKAGYSAFIGASGKSNVFIGDSAGYNNNSGYDNVFIGSQVGPTNTTGYSNVFMGYMAGFSNQGGYSNVFIGKEAGYNAFWGYDNVYIGYRTGYAGHGQYNVFIGHEAGLANAGGSLNTYIGKSAGKSQVNGDYNVYLGLESAANKEGGNYNVFLGYSTGSGNTLGSSNVFIGSNAGYSETGSNKLYIANNAGTPLIYGDFQSPKVAINATNPSEVLDVNGNGRFRGISAGASIGALHITSNGTFTTNTSDVRLKENINTLPNSLSKVLLLRGVNFTWKSEPSMGKRVGFIAQEVEEVVPELVFTNPTDGYKGVNYAEMTAILVEAIKEQQLQIQKLEKRNLLLESKANEIETLKAELKAIKAMLAK